MPTKRTPKKPTAPRRAKKTTAGPGQAAELFRKGQQIAARTANHTVSPAAPRHCAGNSETPARQKPPLPPARAAKPLASPTQAAELFRKGQQIAKELQTARPLAAVPAPRSCDARDRGADRREPLDSATSAAVAGSCDAARTLALRMVPRGITCAQHSKLQEMETLHFDMQSASRVLARMNNRFSKLAWASCETASAPLRDIEVLHWDIKLTSRMLARMNDRFCELAWDFLRSHRATSAF